MSMDQKVDGLIGHFCLAEWWISSFTEHERKYILYRVRTWRAGPDALIKGDMSFLKSSDPASFLNNLTFSLRRPEDNSIARRVAQKALETATEPRDIHSALLWTIRLNYYVRDSVPGALDIAIAACKRQIELAQTIADKHRINYPSGKIPLGEHDGYAHLVKILEKRHEYTEVIRLSEQANMQGWKGDWDKRIERCNRRLQRS